MCFKLCIFFFLAYFCRYLKSSLTFLHFVRPPELGWGEVAPHVFLLCWQNCMKCPKRTHFFSGLCFITFLSWPSGGVCLSELKPMKHKAAGRNSWFNWAIMPSTWEAWWQWRCAVPWFGGLAVSPASGTPGPDELSELEVESQPICEQ